MSKRLKTEDEVKLHDYSYRGELEGIKNLVEQKNVDVNSKDENGETALHHGLFILISKSKTFFHRCKSRTNVYLVCYNGKLDIVKYLVENNANLECKNRYKYTPLHKAIRQGHLQVVKYLLEKGAKINLEDHDGWSLVHWAVNGGYINILKYLADKNNDLECRDKNGNTPLQEACRSGSGTLVVVKYLIEKNVDYDTKNNDGETPLLTACWGNRDVALYLAKLNADIHISCRGGTTPLHRVVEEGHLELTKYFLTKNADWQCVDRENETPFHKALKSRKPALANLFIDMVHNDSQTRLDRAVNRNGFYQISDYHQTLFFKAPRWNLSFKSEMEKSIEQYCDESVICRFKDGPLGVHFLKQPIKLECGHSYCLDCIFDKISSTRYYILFCCLDYVKNVHYCVKGFFDADKDLLDYKIYKHLKFEKHNNPNSLCESFINTANNAFELVKTKYEGKELGYKFFEEEIEIRKQSINGELNLLKRRMEKLVEKIRSSCKNFIKSKEISPDSRLCLHSLYKFQLVNKRVFKNAIGFIIIKGETYTCDIGFEKNKKYYSELNKIYGVQKQSVHERYLTLIGIWRHVRDTAHPSNRYVILGVESLIKLVQSPRDLEKLVQIYDYTLSFMKIKGRSRDKEQIPEMKMRIDIYLEETKKKLSELCNNEILVNGAIEMLHCLCNEITNYY